MHEIGHAIGFYHEIRRPDRDKYVVINRENIQPDELFNFYKLHWLDTEIEYDLSSVMHYTPMVRGDSVGEQQIYFLTIKEPIWILGFSF